MNVVDSIGQHARRVTTWIQARVDWVTRAWTIYWFLREVMPKIRELQIAGFGRRERWMEPGLAADEILAWIEFQVATMQHVGPCLSLNVVLFPYSSAEWAAQPLSEDTPEWEMPPLQPLLRWFGPYSLWSAVGRPQVAAALEQPHQGLYVVAMGDSTALAEIGRRQRGQPSSTQAT